MTTFITTVFNNQEATLDFLDSLYKQTKLPNQIIIVDAYSTDKTPEIIKQYIKNKNNTYFFQKKGNRSIGRNTAIAYAKGDIIVASDVGCRLDSHWVENITRPFADKTIDVVSGYYLPQTQNIFEKCLAAYTCVMPDKIDRNTFLPSSRSIAFKKSAWKDVGGYPEKLDTCEDLIFAKKLKDMKKKFTFKENAIVYWQQRHTLLQAAKQFYSYAKGDGKARFFRKTTPLLFARYGIAVLIFIIALLTKNLFVFVFLFLLFILYLLWAIYKNYHYIYHPLAFVYLPLLQLTADIAVLSVTITGFLQSFYENR